VRLLGGIRLLRTVFKLDVTEVVRKLEKGSTVQRTIMAYVAIGGGRACVNLLR
jgi:hypothetical protein